MWQKAEFKYETYGYNITIACAILENPRLPGSLNRSYSQESKILRPKAETPPTCILEHFKETGRTISGY